MWSGQCHPSGGTPHTGPVTRVDVVDNIGGGDVSVIGDGLIVAVDDTSVSALIGAAGATVRPVELRRPQYFTQSLTSGVEARYCAATEAECHS